MMLNRRKDIITNVPNRNICLQCGIINPEFFYYIGTFVYYAGLSIPSFFYYIGTFLYYVGLSIPSFLKCGIDFMLYQSRIAD